MITGETMLPTPAYTLSNALSWGLCKSHFDQANLTSSKGIKHLSLALLETLPILSQIVSLIELVAVNIFQALTSVSVPNRRTTLIEAYRQIEAIMDQGYYMHGTNKIEVASNRLQEMTRICTFDDSDIKTFKANELDRVKKERTRFACKNCDTFDLARDSLTLSDVTKVAVLNMANATSAGGGVKRGARAQEEDLARRSDLMHSIDPSRNTHLKRSEGSGKNIPEDGIIYSQGVTVFRRQNEDGSFSNLPNDEVFTCDVISSAALIGTTHEDYREKMMKKIEMQLISAIMQGVDCLILGAFGCGAFGNDPKEVAAMYEELLFDCGLYEYFYEIGFAVKVVKEKDQQNFDEFSKMISRHMENKTR